MGEPTVQRHSEILLIIIAVLLATILLVGTGIGFFFDDPVHEVMGLQDAAFQSLYHFTVGGPLEDTRLATLAAYHHLKTPSR